MFFHNSCSEAIMRDDLILFSSLLLSWDSSRLQMEDNQPSPHLTPGLSPGLKLLAGLGGQQLLAYFHRYIAMVGHTHTHTHTHTLWSSWAP